MPPYTRVVSLYERFTVLSAAAIRREVQALLGTTASSTSLSELREVCALLSKSGERRRARLVADALPQPQRQSFITAMGLADPPHASLEPRREEQQTATELSEMSNEALLRLGFALQRPRPQRRRAALHSAAAAAKDVEEEAAAAGHNAAVQRQLFLEFRRRRRYKELMQCVMNWKSKGILPAGRRGGADGVPATSDEAPFNAEEALRGLIFNTSASASASSSSAGRQWEEALRECPGFLLGALREPTAALQFLRKTSVEMVTRLVLWLLRGDDAAHATPAPAAAQNRPRPRVAWDAVASLCFALRPHLPHEKKVVKMDLLLAMLRALRAEAEAAAGGKAATRRNVNPSDAADARLVAMRSAVEVLCASLSHQQQEAQARFIGLPLFIDVAIALRDCGVRVPSALLQCIFLCLGDSQQCQCSEPAPPSSQSPLERELLVTILNSSPAERWVLALRLLRVCTEQHDFVAAAAHLRCFLSGLQSISISRTWQIALGAAQSIISEYHVFPDEASTEKLLLNLHAASWQRAFEVLQLYERGHVAPPPPVLRDLHVVAMKHSSWDVVLRVMQEIQAAGAEQAGFMNHLYCLRAFGCAGKWEEAAALFKELENISGSEGSGLAAYNEVTVAVPVMGMVEHEHWEAVVRFSVAVCRQCGAALTHEGREVALAAEILALVRLGDVARLASFLNRHSGERGAAGAYAGDEAPLQALGLSPSAAELRALLLRAAELHSLCGMAHLHAPVRLVYDVVAGDACHRNHHAERLGPATRGASPQRRLYLPPQHLQRQHDGFAAALGGLIRRDERLFGAAAQQAAAEAMAQVGAGPAFLKAALL
ncbi:uncharacterized protein Tco025E_06535 [Trypanosoma conorhini]|uniref:Uncharacterized protein n=1 Tax=Trypanosoma conorhini TaxID=83891 RepID=A0A422P2X9_9TRYP|nr:uncharacterized protein Tco025E_06535 [Trypanosoma conorhini]RNF12059.1 hypothetical protein Tco025E_06535 [Trypanosoma conorhini]